MVGSESSGGRFWAAARFWLKVAVRRFSGASGSGASGVGGVGGFNKNVAIEFSADGGVTYTAIVGATDLPNTGSFSWTVPNTATTQGRVREASFASPAGASSANFAISSGPADLLFKNGFEGP